MQNSSSILLDDSNIMICGGYDILKKQACKDCFVFNLRTKEIKKY